MGRSNGVQASGTRHAFTLGRRCRLPFSLQAPLIPVVPKQLCRVRRAVRPVAAAHVARRAVQVAAPAHPLGMRGGLGKLLGGHDRAALPVTACSGYLRAGGTSVQLPCAISAAIPMLSPSVGRGWCGLRWRTKPCRAKSMPWRLMRSLRPCLRRRWLHRLAGGLGCVCQPGRYVLCSGKCLPCCSMGRTPCRALRWHRGTVAEDAR